MRLQQLLAQYTEMEIRAGRIQRMIDDRAKRVFDNAFGGSTAFECYHLAYNWRDQQWLTPEQRTACRRVLWLQRKRFNASDIVRSWYTRVTREGVE